MAEAGAGFGRRIAANTLHAASGRAAVIVVWLVYTPFLLDALGRESFGLWSLFFAVTTTLFSLDLGLHQATLRYVADARARGDDVAAGAFATLGLLVFAGLGVLWLVLALAFRGPLLDLLRFPEGARPDAAFVVVAGAVVFTLMGATQVAMATAQGHGRFDLANRSMLAITATHAVGVPVVLGLGWGLRGLVAMVAVGWTVGWIVTDASLRRAIPRFRWGRPGVAFGRFREALRFGGPMQVSSAGFVLHQHLDKFLLVPFVSLATVASYELGYRVSGAALSVAQLFLLAVIPAAAVLNARDDRERLLELYLRGSRYVLTSAAVLFASLAVSADLLFEAWLGPGQEEAALVLRALCLASGILVLTGMGVSVARGRGRTDIEAWFAVVVVAVHAGLAFALMPRYGLAGALVAMVVSTAAGTVLYLALLARALGWSARSTLEPFLVPALGAAVGIAAGTAIHRLLPASGGWLAFVAVSLTVALTTLGITLATGYLDRAELVALARQGPRAWLS